MISMRSTIFKSGNSYLTTIPVDWVKKLKPIEKDKYEIKKVIIGDLIFISKAEEKSQEKIPTYEIGSDVLEPLGKAEIKMKFVTAFLKGKNEIDIKVNSENARNFVEKDLSNYLPYVSIHKIERDKFRLSFERLLYGLSIRDIIDSMVRKALEEQYKILIKTFEEFPNIHDDSSENDIKIYEKTLDGVGFYIKHQLNLALLNPELLSKLGVEYPQGVIYYITIISNLERIGDLNRDISEKLREIVNDREVLKPTLNELKNYYEEAYKVVFDALNSQTYKEIGLKVIAGKIANWETDDYEKLNKARKEVLNWIFQQKSNKLIWYLSMISDYIGGIMGAASNICEAFYNMQEDP
ncbi:MAG: hypothetical protein ABIM42_06775 [candidate division WOR-3 bacterium]